jgi:hypothetical protein
MITIFENYNNDVLLRSWLSFYTPHNDEIKDLISRIKSIMKTSNDNLLISDFYDIRLTSKDKVVDYYYVYDTMYKDYIVVKVYETDEQTDDCVDTYNIIYENVSDNDIKKLYDILIKYIIDDEIYYGLMTFSEQLYSFSGMPAIQEKRYTENTELIENVDWIYKDFDIIEYLSGNMRKLKDSFGDNIYDWSKRIIEDFPEQYKRYLKIKKSRKFNL